MLLYRRTQKFSRLRAMALARPCVRVLCWGKITDAIKEKTKCKCVLIWGFEQLF